MYDLICDCNKEYLGRYVILSNTLDLLAANCKKCRHQLSCSEKSGL